MQTSLPRPFAIGLCWIALATIAQGQVPSTGVFWEVFSGIPGTKIPDLTNHPSFPDRPTIEGFWPHFEGPTNFMDNYGARFRALLVPPTTGWYRFSLASDDAGVLFWSPSTNVAEKIVVAVVSNWTRERQFDKELGQTSANLYLVAGQQYYVEAMVKEGGGGDNLCVRWIRPDGVTDTPIPGRYLRPVGMLPPEITIQPPAHITVAEGETTTVQLEVRRPLNTRYRWFWNGVQVAVTNEPATSLGPVRLEDNGTRVWCVVTNWFGETVSRTSTVTVVADTNPPVVVDAQWVERGRMEVQFSEPVDPTSALNPGNYQLPAGWSIRSLHLSTDGRSVMLDLSSFAAVTVQVSNIRDRASQPNTMPTASVLAVSMDWPSPPLQLLRGQSEMLGPSSRRTSLVISEIHYHPPSRADGRDVEFIELFNTLEWPWDLSGYRLAGEVAYTFPNGTVISGRSFLVIAAAPADIQAVYGVSALGPYSGRLSNGGGKIQLLGRQGEVLLEAVYDDEHPWPAAADGTGHSLILACPSYGEADPRAWAASSILDGTPGGPDPNRSSPYAHVLINEWLAHTDEPQEDFLELWNASTQTVDLTGCYLSDDPATNKFRIPAGTILPPGGFIAWSQSQLGFALDAAGEWILLREPDGRTVVDAVKFGASANGVASGRTPDGSPWIRELSEPTPGAPNARRLAHSVVINEIMYHPITKDSRDEYIELHNAGSTPASVGGWRVRGGISYNIPSDVTIPAGGFLVIAADATRMRSRYSHLNATNCLGNFSGSLSDRSDTVRLERPEDLITTNTSGQWVTNRVYVTVTTVRYHDGGRWGRWADGGGSSLELIDPRADPEFAHAWADSDESSKCDWVTIEHTGVLDHGNSSYPATELHVLALGAGEYDVDNVEVLNSSGANVLTNGTFESGAGGWTFRGTHQDSYWLPTNGVGGSAGLRLVASARGDPGVNRAGAKLTSTLPSGSIATLRARVRWRAGHPEVLLRLRGNWLEATGPLLTTLALGTPGLPNSRATSNAAPAIVEVLHTPLTPSTGQSVRVWARVDDPDGHFAPRMIWRVDPSTTTRTAFMRRWRGGWYSAELPGQPTNALVAFCVTVEDGAGAVRTWPDLSTGREALVRWGETNMSGTFPVYRLWITAATEQEWRQRDKNSNHPLRGTFVLNSDRVVYDMECLYSGSPFHARNYNGPIGSTMCDYVLRFPGDERLFGATDFVINSLLGGEDSTFTRQQICYWMAEQVGIPYLHRRYHHMFVNGVRRGQVCEDVQQPSGDVVEEFFPNDDRGPLHKIEDWFEFQDDGVTFANVNATLGDFRTTGGIRKIARYRWNWRPRAVRGSANDFSELMTLVDAVNATSPYPYELLVPATLDLREWMRVFALERAVSNFDSYGFQRGKNMYAYKPGTRPWHLLIWDMDFSFGLGGTGQTNNPLFGSENDPAIARMKNYPPFQRLFWAALYELVQGPFRREVAEPQMQMRYQALLRNGATGVSSPTSVANWLEGRRNFILAQLADVASALTVALPAITTTNVNYLALSGTAPVYADQITINGVARTPTWRSLNQWELYVPLAEGTNILTVHALDARGQPVSDAPVTVRIVTSAGSEPAAGRIVIHEIMYQSPTSGAAYVELHNAATNTWYDLSGWQLSGVGLTIPDGVIVPPGGFAVFAANRGRFASTYGAAILVAAEYPGGLSDRGEVLRLIRPGPSPAEDQIIDEVFYEPQPPWPIEAAGQGASLQRIHPSLDGRRVGNWAATLGSTNAGPAVTLVTITNRWWFNAGGTNVGSAWFAQVPESWSTGLGLFYNETAPLPAPTHTWLPLTNAAGTRVVTYYFVTTFDFDGNENDVDLQAQFVVDDGAVVYLNGAEVYRLGMPSESITHTTLASRVVGDATWEGPVPLPSSALLRERNLLAVEVHQNSTNSSDVVFGMELQAVPRVLAAATPGATNSVLRSVADVPPLWLNELVVSNLTGVMDNAGERDPWVELFNAGPTALSLDGWYLTDTMTNLLRWAFPAGIVIPPGGFLLVWLDGQPWQTTTGALHAAVRASGPTGWVALVSTLSNRVMIADYLRYESAPADRAFGSYPDGDPIRRKLLRVPTPGTPNDGSAPALVVRINEWMADNLRTLADPADGQYEDWIELYNPTDDWMALGGAFMTDDLSNPTKYRVPTGAAVPPRGFLLVWADNEPTQNNFQLRPDLHVGFALSKNGEAIGVFDASTQRVDAVVFGPQATDVSEGRYPDGGDTIARLPQATPSAPNVPPTTNHAPRIRPIPNQAVFRGATVRFTVQATDDDVPPQTLHWTVQDAPPNAQFDPVTGQFEWTPQSTGGVETHAVRFRVTDSGEPPRSDELVVYIVVWPVPTWGGRATSSPPVPGAPSGFRISTVPGRRYQIEYTERLSPADWRPLAEPFEATEETYEFFDLGVVSNRFYRIVDVTP